MPKTKARAGRTRKSSKDELTVIPGVGPSVAKALRELGIRSVSSLKSRDPERMYKRLIQLRGVHQDRCVLYVFRSVVYYANTARPKPERLLWWNWSDKALANSPN